MRTLTPVPPLHPTCPRPPCSFSAACDLPPGAWAIGHAVSLAAICHGFLVHAFTGQVSLLVSFELPTIPSSTTASPFRHDRFGTLRHRHDLPASHPGTTGKSLGPTSHGQGFTVSQLAPRQGWPNQVHFRYGLVVLLRLLLTLSRENAITLLTFPTIVAMDRNRRTDAFVRSSMSCGISFERTKASVLQGLLSETSLLDSGR